MQKTVKHKVDVISSDKTFMPNDVKICHLCKIWRSIYMQ